MTFFSFLPEDAKIDDVLKGRREVFEPFVRMVDAVSRGESQLSRGERELIGAYVSGLNDCAFCVRVHSASATELGMPENAVDALLEGRDVVEQRLQPLLDLAAKLTRTPWKTTHEDIERAVASGWSERAVQDAVLISCVANFMNRLVAAHGIEGSEDYYHRAGRRIRGQGFSVPEE